MILHIIDPFTKGWNASNTRLVYQQPELYEYFYKSFMVLQITLYYKIYHFQQPP